MKIMPPTIFWTLLLLMIILHFIIPIYKFIYPPITYLGWALIIIGIVFNLWTDNMFKKNKTTVKPNLIPSKLITKGPFKYSRHPMYLGMVLVLLGTAVLHGTIITFIFPIIFIILIESLYIPLEEKNLKKKFGNKYLAYKKKVRRWI